MMDILFFVFNTLIFIQYTRLLPRWGITRSIEKFVFAYFLTMIQIIGTLLFLGAVGWLRPSEAVVLNVIIILSLSYFSYPVSLALSTGGAWKEIIKPFSNKVIISAATAILGWLLVCAYFLPPRDVDGITYHLPFIYESIQRGRWAILPTELRIHFAYPMNVEVLFAWSVLFLGDTRWVDAAQIPIGLWTSGIIYLFARHFWFRRTKAFFLAGLFFLIPIVVAQMGTTYIDLSSSGFLLSSLYLTTRFLTTTKKIYVRLAFLSIGAMMGMKYHLLFWGLVLGLSLFLILIRKKWKGDFLWGLFVIVGLGLGWHLRNYWLFSDWIYPGRATASYWGMETYQSFGEMLISILYKIELSFIRLINNGTVDGGFGRYYGFIVFLFWISWGWCFLFRRRKYEKGEILLFGVALSFLLVVIPIGKEEFQWVGPRILLVAWPILLLTFGRVVFVLNKKPWIHKLVFIICFLGLASDAGALANSLHPHHYWWKKSEQSQFESYRFSTWYVRRLGPCASALDVMTQSLSRRATIFLVATSEQFLSAPFYGRFLQTQIINFYPQFKGDPDFLVYLTTFADSPVWIGSYRKTLSEAISTEYKEVFSSPDGRIFAHHRLFGKIEANQLGRAPDFKIRTGNTRP